VKNIIKLFSLSVILSANKLERILHSVRALVIVILVILLVILEPMF
jgi:hypothetical protein